MFYETLIRPEELLVLVTGMRGTGVRGARMAVAECEVIRVTPSLAFDFARRREMEEGGALVRRARHCAPARARRNDGRVRVP